MSREFSIIFIGILSVLTIIILFLLNFLLRKKNKKQLDRVFIVIFILFLIALLPTIFQTLNLDTVSEPDLIYYDFVSYVGVCYLPVAFLIMALVFSNTKVNFSNKFKLLLIIPTLSILMLWTNNFHHLFYKYYSIYTTNVKFGNYFYIYYPYTMILFGISAIILLRYSIKNSGFFSKQAILISAGIAVPIVSNILSSVGIIPGINVTPIALTVTIILFSFAMFKFDLFKITPIALQTIVDRISDSYVILNEDYEITDFNQTFVNTFEIKKTSNLRGTHFAKFLEDINLKNEIETFAKYLEKVDKDVNVNDFELKINKLDKNFNVEISPIIVGNQLLGILVLFKDITEHVKLDNMRKEFVADVSHELKTPLTSIKGFSETLLEGDCDPDTEKHFLGIINDNADRMEKLVQDLLILSRYDNKRNQNSVSKFDLGELVKKCSEKFTIEVQKKNQDMECFVTADVPLVKADKDGIERVIINIISNGVKYTPDGGKISIYVGYVHNDAYVKIKDTGIGIPKEDLDKIFERFYRVDKARSRQMGGTGLGLSIAKEIIEQNNGNIDVKSTLGKGTEVIIRIPVKNR